MNLATLILSGAVLAGASCSGNQFEYFDGTSIVCKECADDPMFETNWGTCETYYASHSSGNFNECAGDGADKACFVACQVCTPDYMDQECPQGWTRVNGRGDNEYFGTKAGECADGCMEDQNTFDRFLSLVKGFRGSCIEAGYRFPIFTYSIDRELTYEGVWAHNNQPFTVTRDLKSAQKYQRIYVTPTIPSDEPMLDFGTRCESGNGTFTRTLSQKNTYVVLGEIPTDKYDVKIKLTSEKDLDIQLLDMEGDKSKFPEGPAIVGWCDPGATPGGCNWGFLNEPSYVCGVYPRLDMDVCYSGYYGDGVNYGNEFITIPRSKGPLLMRLYAYHAGTATVEYEWGESKSGCCTGAEKCTGTFSRTMSQDEVVVLGDITAGNYDVEINLKSEEDLDIRVADKTWTYTSPLDGSKEPRNIIGWCGDQSFDTASGQYYCNLGLLNGASEESVVYPIGPDDPAGSPSVAPATYTYSGYYGDGVNFGDESIKIDETTTDLAMSVYAYKPGSAVVDYSYWKPRADGTWGPN